LEWEGSFVALFSVHFRGKSFTKKAPKSEASGNIAGEERKRRTRRLPTPHAMFVITACGIAHLRRLNFGSNHAPFNYSVCCEYTFFALCFKIWLCNQLIINCDLI
jgi:hypothetical protein